MNRTATLTDRATSGFAARLAELLAATDSAIAWWGQHRAWPANEPARIDPPRGR